MSRIVWRLTLVALLVWSIYAIGSVSGLDVADDINQSWAQGRSIETVMWIAGIADAMVGALVILPIGGLIAWAVKRRQPAASPQA